MAFVAWSLAFNNFVRKNMRRFSKVLWEGVSDASGYSTRWLPGLTKTPLRSRENSLRAFSKVYTKTGDKGTSSLFNLQRLPKNSDYFQALGNTDELNASVGMARAWCLQAKAAGRRTQDIATLESRLAEIQSRLFDVGAHVATPRKSSSQGYLENTTFDETHVKLLEDWIDEMEATLPPLSSFILPSGGFLSASLHQTRTVTRRAERAVVTLVEKGDCEPVVMRYLNRLSDFFFVAARLAADHAGEKELVYKKVKTTK
eukprot:g63784.t1